MSQAFDERDRFTFEKAKEIVMSKSAWRKHLLDNQDGTFSTMGHIACEWCDYCDAEENVRWDLDAPVHIAKPNAYEEQERKYGHR